MTTTASQYEANRNECTAIGPLAKGNSTALGSSGSWKESLSRTAFVRAWLTIFGCSSDLVLPNFVRGQGPLPRENPANFEAIKKAEDFSSASLRLVPSPRYFAKSELLKRGFGSSA